MHTQEENLLCSGAARSLQRTGVKLFLALMFSNGSCLQTFGPVRYYRGFQPYDFQYFTRRLAVQAGTPALYGKLRDLLGPEVPLPEQPPWRASVTMSIAAREIVGQEDPASPYTRRFEGEGSGESTPEKQEQLDRPNALLQQLTDHGNRGTPYSLEALAAGQGLDLETARQLEGFVKRQGAALELPIEGGLPGYAPPPPVARERFRLSPWDNGVFTFLDSPRVRGLYAEILPAIQERCRASTRIHGTVGPAPEHLGDLASWLADLYDETQQQEDFTLLNTAFDLLCHRGEQMEPVRDYAVEVLRLFWQVLLPGRGQEHLRRFHGRFARFAYDVLYTGGLVEIDPPLNRLEARQGAYSIRPSAFFRAWVRHREPRGAQSASSQGATAHVSASVGFCKNITCFSIFKRIHSSRWRGAGVLPRS